MKVTLDGTPIQVEVRVRTEPHRGFISRNLHFMVMLAFALLCTIISGNLWTLLMLGSLQLAIWVEHQKKEHKEPFFVKWGGALYAIAHAAAILGMVKLSWAIVAVEPSRSQRFFWVMLPCILQFIGYLMIDTEWHEHAHRTREEKEGRAGVQLCVIMSTGISLCIGTSIWIRDWLQ
jgi:uncharacterized membrane protein YjfL (UPF0719 family)